jgi:hypothetical protein
MGTKADGTWQQKCSKDWTDSDEYLSSDRNFPTAAGPRALVGAGLPARPPPVALRP